MMSAPGLTPTWGTKPAWADPVGQEVHSNLEFVSEVTDLTLAQAIADTEKTLNNPDATAEDLRQAARRIVQLTTAATSATRSINDLRKGQDLEGQIAQQALDNGHDASFKSQADIWAEQAAQYYEQSQSHLKKAANIVGNDTGLAGTLTKLFPSQDMQERFSTFWKKVGNAVLGLDVLVQRVKTFPQRLADNITAYGQERRLALDTTLEQWGTRAQLEMDALKKGVADVSTRASDAFYFGVDALGALGDVGRERAIVFNNAAENLVDTKIVSPLVNFVVNEALPTIRKWTQGIKEGVNEQAQVVERNFNEALSKRRAERDGAPQPTRIEPTL